MKYLKVFSLAAVAAMGLTAVFGASSASATVLCTTTTTPCGSPWHIDTVVASIVPEGSATLRSTGGAFEATCGVGSTTTAIKKATGSSTTTPVGSVAKATLAWETCTNTTHTLKGGELEVHHIAGTHNGTVTAKGFEVTVVLSGVSCIYGAGVGLDLGVLTGGHESILHINAVVYKAGGSFLCPSDSVWEGTYTFTNHTEVYVEPS